MYEMCRLRSCAAFGGQWRLFGGVPTPRLSILGLGVPSPRLLARTGHYLESLSEVKLTPQLQTEKQQLLRLIESAWERYSNWLSPAYSREDCRQDALLIFGPDVAPIDWMAMIRRPDQDTSFLSWYAMNNSVAVGCGEFDPITIFRYQCLTMTWHIACWGVQLVIQRLRNDSAWSSVVIKQERARTFNERELSRCLAIEFPGSSEYCETSTILTGIAEHDDLVQICHGYEGHFRSLYPDVFRQLAAVSSALALPIDLAAAAAREAATAAYQAEQLRRKTEEQAADVQLQKDFQEECRVLWETMIHSLDATCSKLRHDPESEPRPIKTAVRECVRNALTAGFEQIVNVFRRHMAQPAFAKAWGTLAHGELKLRQQYDLEAAIERETKRQFDRVRKTREQLDDMLAEKLREIDDNDRLDEDGKDFAKEKLERAYAKAIADLAREELEA